ncbi:uncharacterized protein LOC121265903 [Juglans microcarpa x Juglans regia]|uniref:uncharacterized protein LOC121265903 n=1 Tax=Juglans microcarpa x Juglans regia TaxID=2249226 RepID=UPI001B7F6068|nr:uncharacterized protein LOC121265903 [Juglans microcarpa x Juglans regia]
MKIISWNAHRLGNPRGIRVLCDLVKREVPDILFLQKTRLKTREFEVCKFKLGFPNCLVVDSVDRKGGLTLFWGGEISLSIINYPYCHIDVVVEDDSLKGRWPFTGIYRYPETSQRFKTWQLLRSLCRKNDEAWMVLGDFNKVLHHNEKYGGNPRPDWQLSAFRELVNDCALRDLGFQGNKFTWSNCRVGPHCICERLDRGMANSQWWSKYPSASVTHGLVAYSDHVPFWVNTEGDGGKIRSQRQFRFEEMWVGEQTCEDIIRATWRRGK